MVSHESRGSSDERLSLRVIDAIAEFEGRNPTEVRPVLYDIIDPDALDSLFAETKRGSPRANGYVAFAYGPYEITVYSDSRVVIDSTENSASDSSPSTSKDARGDR